MVFQVYSIQGADDEGPEPGDVPGASEAASGRAEDDGQGECAAAGETERQQPASHGTISEMIPYVPYLLS